ncbi:MAG: cytochrome C [Desulfuromonas sp.]|nr:MAG: cytochrome C [Desulfuromonas sp.]
MIRIFYFLAFASLFFLLWSPSAFARTSQGLLQGAHGDKSVMPKSCRACHKGMNMSVNGEEDSCLQCHGGGYARSNMQSRGYLAKNIELANIETELQKPYRHPVLTERGIHRQNEIKPEQEINAPRHSECVDCHNPHAASSDNPYAGFSGKKIGNLTVELDQEYQLCYLCHSDSQNLPGNSTNKHAEFKTTNRSYHPVEGEGATEFVISLKEPYAARQERPGDISIITCSSCHGSDDSRGPRGPHGSNYEGLLKFNYEMRDGMSESAFAYALCYECHERDSILGNESFPYHSLHIEGKGGQDGTSCFTCHDAHGSVQYASLIRFNEDVVEPLPSGKLKFDTVAGNSRSGSCTLVCHGVTHDDQKY